MAIIGNQKMQNVTQNSLKELDQFVNNPEIYLFKYIELVEKMNDIERTDFFSHNEGFQTILDLDWSKYTGKESLCQYFEKLEKIRIGFSKKFFEFVRRQNLNAQQWKLLESFLDKEDGIQYISTVFHKELLYSIGNMIQGSYDPQDILFVTEYGNQVIKNLGQGLKYSFELQFLFLSIVCQRRSLAKYPNDQINCILF